MPTRVLVVEDEEDMRAFYRRFFDEAHAEEYRVSIVPDAEQALALLRQEPFDVAVLDWALPDLPGTALARGIRSDPRTRRVAILMVSARSGIGDVVGALDAGADDHIAKPVHAQVLAARLRSLCRRRQLGIDEEIARRAPGLAFDSADRVFLDGRDLKLNRKELHLLRTLLRRPGEIHPRALLWQEVWGYESELWEHLLHATVSSLRRKLGGSWRGRIRNFRERGYMIDLASSV